jgi:hypothetical protein
MGRFKQRHSSRKSPLQISIQCSERCAKEFRSCSRFESQKKEGRSNFQHFQAKTHNFVLFVPAVIYLQDDLPSRRLWAHSLLAMCDPLQLSTVVASGLLQLFHLRLPLHHPPPHHANLQCQNHLCSHASPSSRPTQYGIP